MSKKIFSATLILLAMLFICGCSGASYTKEKWVYSELVSIDVHEDIEESVLQLYLEYYNAADVNELETIVLNKQRSENTFEDFYLRFEDKYAHFYDEIMERETTYFYREIDGEVVLALGEIQYEEEDSSVHLHPEICPRFVVSEDGKEIIFTYFYIYYYVSIKCVIEK